MGLPPEMRAATAGRRPRIAAAVVLVLALAACSESSPPANPASSSASSNPSTSATAFTPRPARDPSVVTIWGDSLALQAAEALRVQGRAHGLLVRARAFFGLAPCDAAGDLVREIVTLPDAVVLAFTGNNFTPCMEREGRQATGDAYYAAYREDMGALVAAAVAYRIPVLVVGAPAFPARDNNPDRAKLNAVFREVADAYPGARYVDTAPFISPDGFTRTLPCLSGETAELGCDEGRIAVRAANGVHFDEPRTVPCPSGQDVCRFTAGGHRYANAILSGLSDIGGLSYRPASSTAGVPVDRTRNG